MNPITLLQPPCLVFGNGCAPQSAEWLVARGCRRVLLVTSGSVRRQLGDTVSLLIESGAEVIESRFVPAEPTVDFFETALAECNAAGVDCVLAAGGGSVIDVAKLLAALIPGKQNIREIFGIGLLASRGLPIACLPTTAGTGAEVSPNAILLDQADELKKGVVSPHLVADAAFVDPLLTLSVPPAVTAATGLDALTHCIEAFANRFAHPVVDTYALEGIRLISRHLLTAVRDGNNLHARASLALGSLYGGLCLGPVNTAAVHALAYPLGGSLRVAHGVSNALLLPHVLRFNLPAAVDRYAELARTLGVPEGLSALETAELGIEFLVRLSADCGVPQRLSDLGVSRDRIPTLARAAMQVKRLLKNNPRDVSETDAIAIYQAAF